MAVGPSDSLKGHVQGMDRSGYGQGARAWAEQSMSRPYGQAIWAGHMGRAYGQGIWAGHMNRAYGQSICNMGRAYKQGIWAGHMNRAYGQSIWAGHMGRVYWLAREDREEWGMAWPSQGVHLTILTRDLTCFIYY